MIYIEYNDNDNNKNYYVSVELQKANLEAQSKGEGGSQNGGSSSGAGTSSAPISQSGSSSLAAAIPPLAKLLSNPLLASLSALGNLGGLNDLLSVASLPQGSNQPVQTTGVHRRPHNSFTPKIKASGSPPPKSKNDRNKFAPY